MVACPWCSKQLLCESSVVRHASRVHWKKRNDYDLLVKYGGVVPLCACGCREEVEYSQHFKGYNRFIQAHQCRDPEIRQIMIVEGRATANDPVQRQRHSEKSLNWWADPANVETQQRIIAAWLPALHKGHKQARETDEYRKNVSKRLIKQWASEWGVEMRRLFSNPAFSELVASSVRCFWSSNSELAQRRRKEASDRAIRLQQLGIIGPQAPFKTEWKFNPFTGAEEYMHCSWESAFLDIAIAMNVAFTKCHGIRVPYVGTDGAEHSYVPDFASIERQALCEIKGEEDANDLLKYAAAQRWCADMGWSYAVIRHPHDIPKYFVELFHYQRLIDGVAP